MYVNTDLIIAMLVLSNVISILLVKRYVLFNSKSINRFKISVLLLSVFLCTIIFVILRLDTIMHVFIPLAISGINILLPLQILKTGIAIEMHKPITENDVFLWDITVSIPFALSLIALAQMWWSGLYPVFTSLVAIGLCFLCVLLDNRKFKISHRLIKL